MVEEEPIEEPVLQDSEIIDEVTEDFEATDGDPDFLSDSTFDDTNFNDVIGIGASWGRKDVGNTFVPLSVPIIVDVGDDLGGFTDNLQGAFGRVEQYSIELFYRVQLTQEFQVTPSLQFIIDPAFNLEEDTIAVLGLRGRAEF